jgi:NitT/TauT family transport system substrate-binding protein
MKTLSDNNGQGFSRRRFLSNTSALGAASLLSLPRIAAAEPPPEITKIRLVKVPAICLAPEYLAEELLRLEGFTDVEYVEMDVNLAGDMLVANRADITVESPPTLLPSLDAGKPLVALAGIHGGCYELFGNETIRAVRDMRGKRVAVEKIGASPDYFWITSLLAYVGMDPREDIRWVEGKTYAETMPLFVEGKTDAFLGFPPQPQTLRARKIGHVIVNTAQDRPWEQYYCCMIAARPEFVSRNPVATKRAVRAILKAADICAREPERAARYIVAKGYEPRYEIALEVIQSLSYNRWRTYNPEDTLRFYALRLHDVGMIKSNPQKLIAQGTDWRFLNELKRELKA